MGKLNKKITKLIGIGIVLVVIAGSSYFIYKKFFNKCLTVVCPADSGVCFTLSDQELKNLKQNTLDLFKEKKMKYLKNVKVQTNRIKDLNHLNTKPYINNPRVHGEYSKKYCKQIRDGHTAPISVRFVSDKVGYGVFAEAPIKKGQMIGEYTGVIKDSIFVKDTMYSWIYPLKEDEFGNPVKVELDAKYEGNEMRYVNHSENKNSKKIDVLCDGFWHEVYVAIRDIAKGKQITVSYGSKYWKSRGINPEYFD